MEECLNHLKQKYPNSEVFQSLDKDYIIVRTVIGESNFGFKLPITKNQKFHIDSIRLELLENKIDAVIKKYE